MNINECIDSVALKYGYTDELKDALKRCVPVIAEGKSEENMQIILDTLQRVPIVIFEDEPKKEELDKLEEKMANGRNKNVKFIDPDLSEYGKNIAPGAYCSFPIFDKKMEIIDRVRIYIFNKIK